MKQETQTGMTPDDRAFQDRQLQLEAHLKDAEFMRAETLVCIQHLRKISLYASSIAGFSLPVLAALLEITGGTDADPFAWRAFTDALREDHLIIQFLCLAVGLTCLAFFRIYVGTFAKIHQFARYFRTHLVPAINSVTNAGSPDTNGYPVLHWEEWLAWERKGKRIPVLTDADLSAEAILITLYIAIYIGAFAALSIGFGSFPNLAVAICAVAALLVAQGYWSVLRTVRRASAP